MNQVPSLLSSGPRSDPRVPAHQLTTRNLGAAYPLVAESGLGHRGVLIGHDLLGGSFVYDPFELYAQGIVSNPNMIVFGQIGRGKSAFVKTYLWRQAVFGRRAWVVDPKGEYGALADAWGTAPIALRPGGSVRLNPLDPGPGGEPTTGNDSADGRQVELLASLAAACLGRGLLPRERVAVDLALATVGSAGHVPTLPVVVEAMLEPTAAAARAIRTERATLLEDGRDVALELRRLVHGDLRGMFDGTNIPHGAIVGHVDKPRSGESRPAAIYTRISLDRDENSLAPERQEEACRKRLAVTGIKVGAVFCDRDKSAWKEGTIRPEFDRMLAGVREGTFSAVCIWKLDRLSRRFTQYGLLLKALTDHGVRLISVVEALDTTTAIGKSVAGVITALAEEESANTSMRVTAAEAARAKAGKSHRGGQRCYGYERDDTINQEEAAFLRTAAQELLDGTSLNQVTRRLNEVGSRATTGSEWSPQSLRQTLKSPKLRGVRTYKGELFVGDWEPIFTEEEHARILSYLSTGFHESRERVAFRHFLTGLVVCGVCSVTMVRGTQNVASGHPHVRYTCHKRPGSPACGKVSITMYTLDDYVRGQAIEYADAHESEYELVTRRREKSLDDQIAVLDTEVAAIKQAIEQIHLAMYVERTAPASTYEQPRAQLLQQLETSQLARAQLVEQKRIRTTTQKLVSFRKTTDEPWNRQQPIEVQRAWIRQYVERISIQPALIRGKRFDPRRVSIEWLLGPYNPTPAGVEEADAVAWNAFVKDSQ